MKIFIGAENILSPLAFNTEQNFEALTADVSGIKLCKNVGFNKEDLYFSRFNNIEPLKKFELLLHQSLSNLKNKLTREIYASEKLIVIISTTKGDLDNGINTAMWLPFKSMMQTYGFAHHPLVISNACTSGVIAINTASNLIRAGMYEHAIVIGIDVLSDFVVFGFQSLFAISDEPCAPFDKNRKGVTLGEGCATIVLSSAKDLFKEPPVEFLEGTSSNDANHISGPSRNGEGLYRTVMQTMKLAAVNASEIDYISAHGTATVFNDEMEAIAFHRAGLNDVPLNSLKGFYGHTLGAAGVIETAVCIQSMRHNLLIKSKGFVEPGTSESLNVISANLSKEVNVVLKTASGFGGCNASLLLRKI